MLTMAKRVSLGTTSFYGLLRQHFLVIAIPLPYAYYTFLRLFVCAASAYLAYQHFVHEDSVDRWGVLLVAIALLYDPFIPIYLTREIWIGELDYGHHFRTTLRLTSTTHWKLG